MYCYFPSLQCDTLADSLQFMQLQLEPATGGSLPANSSNSVTQLIRLTNNMHGKVPVVLFFFITCSFTFLLMTFGLCVPPEPAISFQRSSIGFAENFGYEAESKLQGK
jgi:hypothetical protein